MRNIKKAGSYFTKIANILLLAVTINIIFFIVITQAQSPEAIAADFPRSVAPVYTVQAKDDIQRQQSIVEKINENIKIRSYAINFLICLNSFLTILLIYYLYKAADCLINYDIKEEVKEPNIQV